MVYCSGVGTVAALAATLFRPWIIIIIIITIIITRLNPDIYCHVQYRKLGSTNTHPLQIPYEYIPIKTFAINYLKKKYPRKGKYPVNISTFTPIDLWAEFQKH